MQVAADFIWIMQGIIRHVPQGINTTPPIQHWPFDILPYHTTLDCGRPSLDNCINNYLAR